MRTVTSTVYTFDELSDAAKEKARQWWRDLETEDFGSDQFLYEPYETAAKLLGIDLKTHDVTLLSGKTRQRSNIWWSGFSSQGDGASFEGFYYYVKQCARKVRAEFGTDTELHRIADELTAIQKKHGYKLTAKVTQSGNYSHKYTMSADVYKGDDYAEAEITDVILELMRDFADWIYKGLEAEYDSRMEDEYVDETILVNEYEFTEAGERL